MEVRLSGNFPARDDVEAVPVQGLLMSLDIGDLYLICPNRRRARLM